jgi:hypothetical protein
MGLFERASMRHLPETSEDASKKKTGLLDRVARFCGFDAVKASFSSFLEGRAERGGLLYWADSERATMLFSRGFDLTSIHRFSPERSLFAEIVRFGEWNTYTKDSGLEAFVPFFSSSEYESLSALYLRAVEISDRPAVIVLADSLKDANRSRFDATSAESALTSLVSCLTENQSTLETLAKKSISRQMPDSIKEHAVAALDSGKTGYLFSVKLSGLFPEPESVHLDPESEIVYATVKNRILRQTGSMNLVTVAENNDLRVVLFSGAPIDLNLYFAQLMKPLEKTLGFERIGKISLALHGDATELHGIISFLNGDN